MNETFPSRPWLVGKTILTEWDKTPAWLVVGQFATREEADKRAAKNKRLQVRNVSSLTGRRE